MTKIKDLERIGTIGFNNYGSKMIINEYIDTDNIWVNFIDHGYRVKTRWSHFCNGLVKNPYDKTVCGVGFIGEGYYKSRINGKPTHQYAIWNSMLQRCYDKKYHEKRPTYIGCTVAEEWYNFQNFAKWYDENYYEVDGERMNLDKDILIKGNKVYSPESCIFVPQRINFLFVKKNANRGELPIGVLFNKSASKYHARRGVDSLGFHNTPEEAFNFYKISKEKYIKEIAKEYKEKIPVKLYNSMIKYEVEITD